MGCYVIEAEQTQHAVKRLFEILNKGAFFLIRQFEAQVLVLVVDDFVQIWPEKERARVDLVNR
jgi:hypothetical protein